MAENEDHRKKNIQLAKKVNEVKEKLQKCREENIALKNKYESSKIKVTKLQNDKEAIFNSVSHIKQQFNDTFVQHSTGHFDLAQKIDHVLSKCGPISKTQENELNKTSINGAIHPKVDLISSEKQLNVDGHNQVPVNSNPQILKTNIYPGAQQTEFTSTFNGLAKIGKKSIDTTLRRNIKSKHKRRSLRKNVLKKSVQPKLEKLTSKSGKVYTKNYSSDDSKDNVSSALIATSVLRSGRIIQKKVYVSQSRPNQFSKLFAGGDNIKGGIQVN